MSEPDLAACWRSRSPVSQQPDGRKPQRGPQSFDRTIVALRATFAITNRLMTAQSHALTAHRAILERVRMRDADGARAATIDLIGVAEHDLDMKFPCRPVPAEQAVLGLPGRPTAPRLDYP